MYWYGMCFRNRVSQGFCAFGIFQTEIWIVHELRSPRAPWPVATTPRNFFPSAVNLVHSVAFNEDMIQALQSIHISSKRIEMKSSKWDHNHAFSEHGQLWSHLAFVQSLQSPVESYSQHLPNSVSAATRVTRYLRGFVKSIEKEMKYRV